MTVFCVECTGWIDEEDRVEKGAGDTGSQLLYEFLQFNEGATITHIIYTTSSKSTCFQHCFARDAKGRGRWSIIPGQLYWAGISFHNNNYLDPLPSEKWTFFQSPLENLILVSFGTNSSTLSVKC